MDTIDKIDFSQLEEVAKGGVALILDMSRS
jgi:hypothetical protein